MENLLTFLFLFLPPPPLVLGVLSRQSSCEEKYFRGKNAWIEGVLYPSFGIPGSSNNCTSATFTSLSNMYLTGDDQRRRTKESMTWTRMSQIPKEKRKKGWKWKEIAGRENLVRVEEEGEAIALEERVSPLFSAPGERSPNL